MNTEAIMSARMMFYGDPSFRATSMWVTLKEDPDLQQLQEAVDAAVRIHPWAAYGIREADGMFYYSDHLSDSIQIAPWEDADPPALGGDDAQGHLLGVFYRGRRLYFSFFHGLTQMGRGLSLLRIRACAVTGLCGMGSISSRRDRTMQMRKQSQ